MAYNYPIDLKSSYSFLVATTTNLQHKILKCACLFGCQNLQDSLILSCKWLKNLLILAPFEHSVGSVWFVRAIGLAY